MVQGYFNYFAVPGNAYRLCGFRYEVCRTWRRMLQRRSQRHNQSWERFGKLEKCYIPPFSNTHSTSKLSLKKSALARRQVARADGGQFG